MSTITEKLKWLIEADATSAIKGFEKTGDAAEKNLTKAQEHSKKLGGQLTKVGAGAVAAGGIIGGALVKAAGAFEDLAIASGKMADATGLSVEEASRWIEVAGDMGIGADVIQSSLGKMNKTLGATPQAFKDLGIEIAATADGSEDVNGTFLNTIARLQEFKDPAERAAAAAKIFGKGWQGAAELLNLSTTDIKTQLASVSDQKVINDDELTKAKEYRASLDALGDSVEDLTLAIGQEAAPIIGGFAKGLSNVVGAATKLDTATGGVAGGLLATGAAGAITLGSFALLAGQVVKMKSTFTELTPKMQAVGYGLTAVAVAAGVMAANAASDAKALAGLSKAADELSRATDPQVLGQFNVAILEGHLAGKDLAGTLREVAQANLEGAKRTLELIQAQVGAGTASADLRAQGVALRVAIADEEVAREQAVKTTGDYTDTTEEATAATEGNAIALAASKGATDSLKDATAEATRKSDAFADSLQNQLDKLEDLYPKEYDAVKAKYDYADAQVEAMTKIDELNTTLDTNRSKQEDVDAATRSARDAILDQSEKFATLEGATLGSQGALARQISSLEAQRDTLAPGSPLRVFLDSYITDLKNIPSNIDTFMNLHVSSSAVNPGAPGYIPPGSRGAEGGIIKARPGGRVILAGEAGSDEALIPLDGQHGIPGGSGIHNVTLNVYAGLGTDGYAVSKVIVNNLAEYDRRNGTHIVTPAGR